MATPAARSPTKHQASCHKIGRGLGADPWRLCDFPSSLHEPLWALLDWCDKLRSSGAFYLLWLLQSLLPLFDHVHPLPSSSQIHPHSLLTHFLSWIALSSNLCCSHILGRMTFTGMRLTYQRLHSYRKWALPLPAAITAIAPLLGVGCDVHISWNFVSWPGLSSHRSVHAVTTAVEFVCAVQRTLFPCRNPPPLALAIILFPLLQWSLSLGRRGCNIELPRRSLM